MCACDGFLHLLHCGKTYGNGFSRSLFLVTGFFVAREHPSDIHLGAFGSQNHNGTEHWAKLGLKPIDTRNTIDNRNAGVFNTLLPLSSLTTSLRCNLHPRVCHLCCTSKLVLSGAKVRA